MWKFWLLQGAAAVATATLMVGIADKFLDFLPASASDATDAAVTVAFVLLALCGAVAFAPQSGNA